MIIITHVDAVNIKDEREVYDYVARSQFEEQKPTPTFTEPKQYETITSEMISGTRLRNSAGIDIMVGMSKQVQQALGISIQVINDMSKMISEMYYDQLRLKGTIKNLEEKIKEFELMPVTERLKFLFRKSKK